VDAISVIHTPDLCPLPLFPHIHDGLVSTPNFLPAHRCSLPEVFCTYRQPDAVVDRNSKPGTSAVRTLKGRERPSGTSVLLEPSLSFRRCLRSGHNPHHELSLEPTSQHTLHMVEVALKHDSSSKIDAGLSCLVESSPSWTNIDAVTWMQLIFNNRPFHS
jgi:hypothetical protein